MGQISLTVHRLSGPRTGREAPIRSKIDAVHSKDGAPLVMLVDGTDEADAVAEALKVVGLRLVRAGDTITAESLFVSNMPNLIVLSLEDEGAAAFCDLIGAIPRGSGVPVVLMGGADEALRRPVEENLVGPHAFLPRPIDTDALVGQVETLLGFRDGPDEARSSQSDPDQRSTPPETARAPTREPTQILDKPTSEGDELLDKSFGFSLTDFLAEGKLGFDFQPEDTDGPLPWEVQLDVPPPGDDDLDVAAEDEPIADELEETHHSEPPSPDDDQPAPWASAPDASSVRPERTQVLGDTAVEEEDSGNEAAEAGVTELSDDFRRVIDEVAHRLFPEASPEEYQDEHFEELSTVVPVVDRAVAFEDLDEYSLEAMETFTAGNLGFTLSGLDGSRTEQEGLTSGDTRDEGETGAAPTQRRSVTEVTADEPPPAAPQPPTPELEPPTHEQTDDDELLARASGSSSAPQPFLELDGESLGYGELSRHAPATLLAASLRAKLDGRLLLRAPSDDDERPRRRAIVLDQGHPVAVTSGLAEDRLIELMRRSGRLTTAQHERAKAELDASGRRAGAVLVEQGVISPKELFPLVRWHYRELLHSCFSWREGTFWLEPQPPLERWRIRLDQEGQVVLLEGLRRRGRPAELETALGGSSARLIRTDESDSVEGVLEDEEPLLPLCDGRRPLSEILERSNLERGQALAALFGLHLLGAVEVAGTTAKATSKTSAATLARARLEHRLILCQEADYFTLLGLSPDASSYEIRRAHEDLRRELAPGRLATIDAADLDEQLDDLRYLADEAFEVLSDEALREAYRQSRF